MAKSVSRSLGVGLDIGTMNLMSAKRQGSEVVTRRMRDLFIDLPASAKKMLKLGSVPYIQNDEILLVLGDEALEVANMFGKEGRRPLKAGLVSPDEVDSLKVLGFMIKDVLGDPREPDEHCYFSVPAAPVDIAMDVIYHKGVFTKIVKECGFTPHASNEAMAIVFAETAKEGFSGIGISFGSGMTNIAVSINNIEGLSFSVARGGDWIDNGAAKSVGSTAARICAIKEKGIQLSAPKGRDEEAIAFYYKALIEYALENLARQFVAKSTHLNLNRPIPIVVGGGTSLAGGFMDFFKEVFESKRKTFPIQISEIRHASDPLGSVAKGLLILASQEYEDDDE
jgi:hypothetical protein